MVEPLSVSIRQAFTGELLCEWARSEVGELRVWELKQRFCQVTASEEYFAWQLHDDRRPLRDHFFVANVANNNEQGLSLLATKRHLRSPTLDEQADLHYYVSISHRRKLWKLISQGIKVTAVSGASEKVCILVRAIEANYVEPSEHYSFPDTVQTLLWAQCDPNQAGIDQRLPLNQAIRSGDDHAVEVLLRARANPQLADIGIEVPLLLAARVGAPSYVRLLLQFRAHPAGSADSHGSSAPEDEVDAEWSRVLSQSPLALVTAALGDGPTERPTSAE